MLCNCPVMSNSLQPHGLQHARIPCPSPSPRACSNSCPLSWWCRLVLCHPLLLLLPSVSPSIKVFSSEVALPIRWPKYWSFSISPSCEYSGLISFRIDWFSLLAVQDPSCCKENPGSLLHAATKTWPNQIKITFKKLIFLVIINKEGSFLARLTTKNTWRSHVQSGPEEWVGICGERESRMIRMISGLPGWGQELGG